MAVHSSFNYNLTPFTMILLFISSLAAALGYYSCNQLFNRLQTMF